MTGNENSENRSLETITASLTYHAGLLTCVTISAWLLYKLARPYFNARVVCWFCQEKCVVPYGNRNCWDCPKCEQYNGFTSDGGYNKPIPAQHLEDLNHPISSEGRRIPADVGGGGNNKLCEKCNRSQLLKVRHLANFIPISEANFDAEVEAYEAQLERTYRLCFSCEKRVNRELHRQNELLKPKLSNYRSSVPQTQQEETFTPSYLIVSLSLLWWACLTLCFLYLVLSVLGLPFARSLVTRFRLHGQHHSLRGSFAATGLMLQLGSTMGGAYACGRVGMMHLILCLLWLVGYSQATLRAYDLLPLSLCAPGITVGVAAALSLLTLLTKHRGVNNPRIASYPEDSSAVTRDGYPTSGYDNLSYDSDHSDSGVSGSHCVSGSHPQEEKMDCSVEQGISGLTLGQPTQRITHSTLDGYSLVHPDSHVSFGGRTPVTLADRLRRSPNSDTASIVRPASFRPASSCRLSPGSELSYRTGIRSLTGRHSDSRHMSASVRNYTLPGNISPGSASIYTQAYSQADPALYRAPPERVSLLTQVILGVSLGVNISIAAFFMGRISANSDFLSGFV